MSVTDLELRLHCYKLAVDVSCALGVRDDHKALCDRADAIAFYVSQPLMHDTMKADDKEFDEFCRTLSVRLQNVLKSQEVNSFRKLYKTGSAFLMRCPNFGKKSLKELNEVLETSGLKCLSRLGTDFPG